jgi:hypothetical protein
VALPQSVIFFRNAELFFSKKRTFFWLYINPRNNNDTFFGFIDHFYFIFYFGALQRCYGSTNKGTQKPTKQAVCVTMWWPWHFTLKSIFKHFPMQIYIIFKKTSSKKKPKPLQDN